MFRNMLGQFGASLQRFMYGRNGVDQLSMALMAPYLLFYLLFVFTDWMIFNALTWAIMVIVLWRTLSRRLDKRRAENAAFVKWFRPLRSRLVSGRNRIQDREHRYFRCPGCGQQMRVPRGKGRITVHCRSCGASFEEKS